MRTFSLICLCLCCPAPRGLLSVASGPPSPRPRLQGGRAGRGAQAPELRVLERGCSGTFLDQGASLCFCIGRQILYRWATREALSHAFHLPAPSWFIFNEGRLLPIPVLASTTSHGSAQAHVSSSLLTCLPPPTPPHRSGEFRSPSSGSLSHTENSHWLLFYTWWCVSFHVTLSILFSMTCLRLWSSLRLMGIIAWKISFYWKRRQEIEVPSNFLQKFETDTLRKIVINNMTIFPV